MLIVVLNSNDLCSRCVVFSFLFLRFVLNCVTRFHIKTSFECTNWIIKHLYKVDMICSNGNVGICFAKKVLINTDCAISRKHVRVRALLIKRNRLKR